MTNHPKMDNSLLGRTRDRIGWAIASAGLYIATPWYRQMISGAIKIGLRTAAEVAEKGKEKK